MNTATVNKLANPELGEIYAGAIINPDGTGHHIIRLPGDNDDATWDEQMEWAKSIGGDLPDRVEQAMFYKNMPEQFKKDWYWSNTQREAGSAWSQHFTNGHQLWRYTLIKCRAVAVRRVPFNHSSI